MSYPIDLLIVVPRSGSTILERVLKNPAFCSTFFHEPNSDIYYQDPSRAIPNMDLTRFKYKDYETFKKDVREAAKTGRVLIKDMAYCLYENILKDKEFVDEVNIVCLIRDPLPAIRSHLDENPAVTDEEVGFVRMQQFTTQLQAWQKPFCLVDYADLVGRKEDTLFTICKHLGRPYHPGMDKLEPDESFKNVTAKFAGWHVNANNSTQIQPQHTQYKTQATHPRVLALLQLHQPSYDLLLSNKTTLETYTAPVKTELRAWQGGSPKQMAKAVMLDKTDLSEQNNGSITYT